MYDNATHYPVYGYRRVKFLTRGGLNEVIQYQRTLDREVLFLQKYDDAPIVTMPTDVYAPDGTIVMVYDGLDSRLALQCGTHVPEGTPIDPHKRIIGTIDFAGVFRTEQRAARAERIKAAMIDRQHEVEQMSIFTAVARFDKPMAALLAQYKNETPPEAIPGAPAESASAESGDDVR